MQNSPYSTSYSHDSSRLKCEDMAVFLHWLGQTPLIMASFLLWTPHWFGFISSKGLTSHNNSFNPGLNAALIIRGFGFF